MLILMLYNLTCSWIVNALLLVFTTAGIVSVHLTDFFDAAYPVGVQIFTLVALLSLLILLIVLLIEKELQMRKSSISQFDLIVS